MNGFISADDNNFDNFLDDQKAIIVDFYSPTCQPCKQIEPGLQEIATDYGTKVKVLKVNVNEAPRTSARFLVRGLPTLLFIKDGSVRTQMVGKFNRKQIETTLKEVI